MDFSLSSSLVGSAVLNPDKLSLDLQFAADKTLTARKGPTPTFTRGSTATFVGSDGLIQSAAVNTPRFDHDPITGVCKGLLIEEQRTNLCVNSNLLTSASWIPTGTTVVTDAAGPDGANAAEVAETAITSNHNIGNSGSATSVLATSVVSGTNYTGSMFFKKVVGNIDWVQLTLGSGGFGTAQYANFNIGNGAVGNFAGLASGTSPQIQNYGNGWYRCSITVPASVSSTTSANIVAYFTNNIDTTARGAVYAGNTANKVITAMGQFEAGSFPTSYIPTTTASVIRSADVCSISGSDFSGFYNLLEGTLLVTADEFRRGSSFGPLLRIANSAGQGSNRYNIGAYGNKSGVASPLEFRVDANGSNVYSALPTSPTSSFKAALAYAVDNMRGSLNGVLATADTPPSGLIIGANTLDIASVGAHLVAVRYYKKRLANAKLQTLTV